MGGACLRGHGHHWAAGGSGGAAPRGQRESHLADEPDAAGADARTQLLRARGDTDAVRHRHSQAQPDAVPNAQAVDLGLSLVDRVAQRLGESVPVANRDGDAVTIAEWQREGFELALS